jgi:streptogramin lyase
VALTGTSCALAGFVPNPSSTTPVIEFGLDGSDGELTVVDLAGRVWLREQVGRVGSGTQRFRFDPSARLPAGVYLIRLVSGTTAIVRRGLILD